MADVPDRLEPSELRASDADRERVAEVLRQAAAEGRLDLNELDERLGLVYAARTYADLAPLTRDLPTGDVTPLPLPGPAATVVDAPATGNAVAFMSEFTRKGRWVVPRTFNCLALFGGGKIDLREARIPPGEVRIQAFAIMGGIDIIVPDDADVHVSGIGIMGGFDQGATGEGRPGAPRIVVSGLALMGGVTVKRRPRRKT